MLAKARNRRVISAFLLDGCHGLWCWCYACRRMDFVFRPQFGGKALALILLTLLFRDSSTVFGSDKYLNTPGGFFKTLGLLLWMVNDRIELDLINTHFGVCLKKDIQQGNNLTAVYFFVLHGKNARSSWECISGTSPRHSCYCPYIQTNRRKWLMASVYGIILHISILQLRTDDLW